MTALAVEVLGVRFFSTHHESAADLLAGRERAATPPAFELLVGRARRFTSLVTQLHLEVCGALRAAGAEPALAVFATCHGEIQTAEKLIADFHASAMVSSARFALSVHNTASGLYSVATGSSAPTTTVTGDHAVAAGWLEAALTALEEDRPVLLSIADEPVPAVFQGPPQPVGVAAGFLLAPALSSPSSASSSSPSSASSSSPSSSPSAPGRRVELAFTPGRSGLASDASMTPAETLARVVQACASGEATTVTLGGLQEGSTLELRFSAQGSRP